MPHISPAEQKVTCNGWRTCAVFRVSGGCAGSILGALPAQQGTHATRPVHQGFPVLLRDGLIDALGLCRQQLHVVHDGSDAPMACSSRAAYVLEAVAVPFAVVSVCANGYGLPPACTMQDDA